MKTPDKAVSSADANRRFSEILRKVRGGRSYVVTSHGKPVARIVPVGSDDKTAVRARAWRALVARLRTQPVVDVGKWTRDELYDDEP